MKYYTIYKTTNKLTKEIYVGQHQTSNINDGYIGSGAKFRDNVSKFGIENFTKEILFNFDNFEDMNNKEIEIVNKDFIKRSDTLNVILGGGFNTHGFLTARLKGEKKYSLVSSTSYDKHKYETPTSGSILIIENGITKRISCLEYSLGNYKTVSTGYVTVYFIEEDNRTGRILLEEYDNKIHKKVFGGIVGTKNGIKQYITLEDIKDGSGISNTKNKVTVIELSSGKGMHVSKEEFAKNRHLYKHNTEGSVTGRHNITNERRRFLLTEITESIRNNYSFSSKGQQTVYSMQEGRCVNIPKGTYNKDLFRSPFDIKFNCISNKGDLIFTYFGSKSDFFIKYNFPITVWEKIKSNGVWNTNRKKGSEYNGCSFEIIDWKTNKRI